MTHRTCIAIADATRARLFIHERENSVAGARDELVEHAGLVNPARRLATDAHADSFEDVFARLVSEQLEGLASSNHARRVVICASPHMLGLLRRHFTRPGGTTCDELPKDLVKLAPLELRAQLGAYGMLPPLPARANVS